MVQVHGQCSFGEIVDVYVLGFSDYPCPKFVHLAVVVLFFQESTPGKSQADGIGAGGGTGWVHGRRWSDDSLPGMCV